MTASWRNIETAPKNGKQYLAWANDLGYFVLNQPSKNHAIGTWSIVDGEWRGFASSNVNKVTHWRLLHQRPVKDPTHKARLLLAVLQESPMIGAAAIGRKLMENNLQWWTDDPSWRRVVYQSLIQMGAVRHAGGKFTEPLPYFERKNA